MFSYKLNDEAELRLLEVRHANEMFTLIDQNREHLGKWLSWVDYENTVDDAKKFIKSVLHNKLDDRGFVSGIWYRGKFAGAIGLHIHSQSDKRAEIGYWLGKEFEGKGLITMSCRALINHAFTDLDMNRIEIRVATGNARSRAVPERLGFTTEGILRQQTWLYDKSLDMVMYSLLKGEWSGG